MMFLILVFVILGGVFYLIGASRAIGVLLVSFLGLISLLTPFWPFVLLGIFAIMKANERTDKAKIEEQSKQLKRKALSEEDNEIIEEHKRRFGGE